MMLVSLLIITNLPKITIDTSTEGFLHKDDPVLVEYEEFKSVFGQDEKILIVVKNRDIFALENLQKLKRVHERLQTTIPHLADITSLINARNTRGEGDRLIVEDLFESFPQTQQELDITKNIALQNPMYKNLLINEALTMTTIILEPNAYETPEELDVLAGFGEEMPNEAAEFLSDTSKSEMVRAANAVAQELSSEDFEVFVAGSLAVNDYNKLSVQKDMQKFIKLVLVMMMVFLFVIFRRLSAVILPIFIVLLSLLTTMAFMALFGVPITIPTQILPSFLLAVGIGAVVHLLAVFFKHYNTHKNKNAAIIHSLAHSGLAIIMTSLTTAAGLLSFSSASISPIADLGVFAALGVIIALLNTIILLPALLSALPLKAAKEGAIQKSEQMDRVLLFIANLSINHAKKIVTLGILLMMIWGYFAMSVAFKHDPLAWQPALSPIKIATERVDNSLRGSVTMEILIDTQKTNGLYNAKLLQSIDTLAQDMQKIKTEGYFVGKAWSVGDVLKEIHKALHENSEAHYKITDNDKLIPQEFLLFENSGSDDLSDFVDSDFSKARITLKLPWMEAGEYEAISQQIESLLHERLGDDVKIQITGMVPLFGRTLAAAMDSMALSYAIAFGLIAFMMVLLLGSLKIGLLSMVPNILPAIMTLGFMSMVGMPLDMFTMLVGAIVIGLSVDDTVHYFYNFSKYHHQGYSVRESAQKTMLGTGRALVATTIVLSLGFYVYTFASLSNLINFGILAGGAITLALISNVLLGPALLKLTTKEKK